MNVRFSPVRGRSGRFVAFACIGALSMLMSAGSAAQRGSGDTPFVDADRQAWPLEDLAFRSAYTHAETKRGAAARLARFPDSVNTVAWLAHAGRTGDALDVLQRVIARDPIGIADGLEALTPVVTTLQRNQTSEYNTRLSRLLSEARARLPDLDRESAARLELEIGSLDSARSLKVRQVPQTYQGTLAARLAAVDNVRSGDVLRDLAEYDAIALREGTNEVAAKARYSKATTLVTRFEGLARETGNTDPTEAWLDVLAIVRDLESGRYPPGPWVDDSVTCVASFSLYAKSVSPINAARLLQELRLFVVEHQTMLADNDSPIPGLVTGTMPALAAVLPDGAAVMDRQLAELGRELRDPAAGLYLKALWLDSPGGGLQPRALPPRLPTHEADVRKLLASAAAATRDSVHARFALAHLADRESRDPVSFDLAHAHFEEYLRRFASGPVGALAALRLGHVEQAQRRHRDAATRFAEVARANRNEPVVRVLALAYAARASEDDGRFDAARDYYRQAAAAWTPDLGDTMGVNLPSPRTSSIEDAILTGIVARCRGSRFRGVWRS